MLSEESTVQGKESKRVFKPKLRRLRYKPWRLALSAVGAIVLGFVLWNVFAASSYPASRDIYQWPFSRYSFWNMPIGQNAKYEPVGMSGPWDTWLLEDITPITMDPSAPKKSLSGHNVHVSASNSWNGDWNGCAVFLEEDNKTILQGQPLVLSPGGTPSWQYFFGTESLTGEGGPGCHGGSHLSGLGGLIRKSDIADKNKPIRHALNISIPCSKYCSPTTSGYRAPATSADGAYLNSPDQYGCGGYGKLANGSVNTNVKMGSLLALKPDFNINQFAKGTYARQVAEAMRNYGAYVVDESCSNHIQYSIEQGASMENEPNFLNNMIKIWESLNVITNNYTNGTNIGGGGAPINDSDGNPLCYAPPFSNAGFADSITNNPNGNVQQSPACTGGPIPQTTTPPPAPTTPTPTPTKVVSKPGIAFYGDSLTGDDHWAGYIGNGLAQKLTAAGLAPVYAQGCGGMKLSQFVGTEAPESFCQSNLLSNHQGDIKNAGTVVVAFFSNDNSSASIFKSNANKAIAAIRGYNKDAKIIFIKGFLFGDITGTAMTSAQSANTPYNQAFSDLANANPGIVRVIDVSNAFKGNYMTGCRDANNQDHPTSACSSQIASEIANQLKIEGTATPIPATPTPTKATTPTPTTTVANPSANLLKTIGANITASSSLQDFSTAKVVDGDTTTNGGRWISNPGQPATVNIDLKANYKLSNLQIVWAADTTKNFSIESSVDGKAWATVTSPGITNGALSQTMSIVPSATLRYLRINLSTLWNNSFGHSIREISAEGQAVASFVPTPTPTAIQTPIPPPARDAIPPVGPTTQTVAYNFDWLRGMSYFSIAWPSATDNRQVAGYEIRRNGSLIGTTNATHFTDYGIKEDTSYRYQIFSLDNAGNRSSGSAIRSISMHCNWFLFWKFCSAQ